MERRAAVTLAAILAVCTVWLAVGRDSSGKPLSTPRGDAAYYYAYLPSMWLDGDLDLADEYDVTGNAYRFDDTELGRPGNVFGIGPAVLASPMFLATHGVARITGTSSNGFSDLEQGAYCWLSVLVSTLALVFPARIARRRLDAGHLGLLAAVLVFAGGPVFYYAVLRAGTAHPFATLFCAWFVDAWDASYDRPRTLRTWARLSLLLGLMSMARPQLATWGLLLVSAGVSDLIAARGRAEILRCAARLSAGVAIVLAFLLPPLLAWKAIYGDWTAVPQGPGYLRWDAPAWSETLFSSRNGLLPWAPLYAVAVIGMIVGLRRAPRLFGALLGATLAQALVNGAAYDWWGGGAFGGRRFDSTYVAFALGLVPILTWSFRAFGTRWLVILSCAMLASSSLVVGAEHNPLIAPGRSAADVYRSRLGRFGVLAAFASELSNLPARAAFAWRHDTDLDAYDRVVGVHWLGDSYPGLNAGSAEPEEAIEIMTISSSARRGFVADVDSNARMVTTAARLLVPLNRVSGIQLAVFAANPNGGHVRVAWNGAVRAESALEADMTRMTFAIDDITRGVNELTFEAPPGTVLRPIVVRATGPY